MHKPSGGNRMSNTFPPSLKDYRRGAGTQELSPQLLCGCQRTTVVTLGRDERLNVKQGGGGNECMQQELSVTIQDVMPNLHKQRR